MVLRGLLSVAARMLGADAGADVVVVGGVSMEYVMHTPHVPVAHDVEAEQFLKLVGGRGANQATAVSRLEVRPLLIARIGNDAEGAQAKAELESEGVLTSYVVEDSSAGTGAAIVTVDRDGESQSSYWLGANAKLTVSDVMRAEQAIKATLVLLVQLDCPLEVVAAALRIARGASVYTILDPAPATELPDSVLELVDFITVDIHEARVLTGIEVTDEETARAAAANLVSRGVGAAAVQAGPDGTFLMSPYGNLLVPVYSVDVVDKTGSSDAFAAAVAAGMATGEDVRRTVRFANAAAALATTVFGGKPSLPSRTQVLEFLQ
jgi:Sugar kinases, ribokinase family